MNRLLSTISYNKDWVRYLTARWRTYADDEPLNFRLRNGMVAQVRADTRFILNEIFVDRVYDIAGLDWTSIRNVLDLGGNMGLFALYACSRAPGATVHSFEPHPGNAGYFQRNIDRNKVPAKLYQMAVSDKRETLRFDITGNSAEYKLAEAGAKHTIEVEAVTPAEMFNLTGNIDFDFAKIDIEGAERQFFAACSDEDLRRFKAVVIEWHHKMPELLTLTHRFRAAGFDAQPVLIDHIRYLKARRR